jgi:predicted DNA-binding transcriptional regulator AlpA
MATVSNNLETLINEHEVARVTGLSIATVRRWRLLRQGPRYLKIGAAVRYRPADVMAWLESRPGGGTHHQAEARGDAGFTDQIQTEVKL